MLQSAYRNYQIGPFENLHQPVKNTPLVVLGERLKVFFQYSLRFEEGFSDNDVSVVRHNARQLKFKPESTGFED